MEKEIFENASEVIAFIPKSKYRWVYYIDAGKPHIIHQDNVGKFIKQYIEKFNINFLQDIMMRHQPFLVLIADKKIVELHKQKEINPKERYDKINKKINDIIKYNNVASDTSIDEASDIRFNSLISNFKNF